MQTHDRYNVRPARNEDLPAIIASTNAAFAVEDFLDGTRTDAERILDYVKAGEFLVCEEGGRIVASVYTEIRGERAYFGMLAVDPIQQGKGLGRVMVGAAEEHARAHGCKFMDVSVLSLRPELPPFYRKLGYVDNGTDEFRPSRPLKDGLDCHIIRMAKPLV